MFTGFGHHGLTCKRERERGGRFVVEGLERCQISPWSRDTSGCDKINGADGTLK